MTAHSQFVHLCLNLADEAADEVNPLEWEDRGVGWVNNLIGYANISTLVLTQAFVPPSFVLFLTHSASTTQIVQFLQFADDIAATPMGPLALRLRAALQTAIDTYVNTQVSIVMHNPHLPSP
jgi:hypothetical protein